MKKRLNGTLGIQNSLYLTFRMNNRTQQAEILQTKSYFKLYYYEEGFLHIDWQGYINVEEVKEGCELIFEAVQSKQCYQAINDNRKVKGTWTQAIKWLEQNFMPRLVQIGVQKVAFLYAPHQSARYSVDRLLEVNDQYQAQTFEEFKMATNWLIGDVVEEKTDRATVLIKTLSGYTYFQLAEIYYISRHSGQTLIQTADQQFFTKKSLSGILEILPPSDFFRIHKSHIVNVSKIRNLKYHEGGYYHLFLNDFGNIYLTVSRKYVKDLKLLLG